MVFIDPGARKLTAHTTVTTAISSSRSDCCLTSEQYVVTGGHCSSMERQRTPPGPSEKEQINYIEPHMWPPNSPDINPVDHAIWGALQQRDYHAPTTIQDGGRTEASDSRRMAKLTEFH